MVTMQIFIIDFILYKCTFYKTLIKIEIDWKWNLPRVVPYFSFLLPFSVNLTKHYSLLKISLLILEVKKPIFQMLRV